MTVQTKILILLLAIIAVFVGGLAALKLAEGRRFKAIADARAVERNRIFDEFLKERGDPLKALMDDSTNWDDFVRALMKNDTAWAERNLGDSVLTTYQANAVWVYRPDGTLFYSRNNRYAENLRELPLPPGAFARATEGVRDRHFFLRVPQGWMEIRGATIHPSRDRYRETTPQGWLFVGHIWIDDNIRRMSMFTGYSIRILPLGASGSAPPSKEEQGLISFTRPLPGWDGRPVAQILVQHDSPIIRELNRASHQLFIYLMIFAALLFVVLAVSLVGWVRRPLRLISRNLEHEDPEGLATLERRPDEFGKLAQLILKFRRTQETLSQTEEQLRHSLKLEAVGRLAGGIAHDFNNLLTAIIGYSELLEEKLQGDGAAREYAQLVRKAGERAADLTRQLLAFSRKQLLQPRVLDLNELLGEMRKLLQRVIGEHIRIVIDPAADDARVCADPTQLEQVVLNLGVNARDAMLSGGTLTIRTRSAVTGENGLPHELAPGRYVELSVTDTGSGMDEATRLRIFEPFFTTKGPGKGTGLGLSTVHGIVAQSDGAIAVESTLGVGSTFRIFLPHAERPVDLPAAAPPPVERSKKSETVLVVEDEEVVRQLVCSVLEEVGYHILCAATPGEALQKFEAHGRSIDLLVSDVIMPEMHGPALAHALALRQPDLKILYISGYSDNDIGAQGIIGEDLQFLQKPFTQQSLIRKVREVLDASPSPLGAF